MKRIVAILLSVMMLAGLAVSTSAAGEILWYDDFTNGFNPNYWIVENNEFFVDDLTDPSNPCLAAYSGGVVSQMEYRTEINGNGLMFTNCSIVSNIQVREYDGEGSHKVGFWWRDDFAHTPDDSDPGYELGEIWNLLVDADNMTVVLLVEGEETPRVEVPVTDVEVGGDWFSLGWRITAGRMEGFINNQKVIDYSHADISAARPSPFLLINSNCYVAFDDMVVATADYDLFDEGLGSSGENTTTVDPGTDAPDPDVTGGTDAPDPENPGTNAPNPENPGTNAPVNNGGNAGNASDADNNAGGNEGNANTEKPSTSGTVAVEVTDDKGQVVTDDKGEKVTSVSVVTDPAPADTNKNKPTAGNATATGDATFVVIAAMVATLGCAVVIKKASVK